MDRRLFQRVEELLDSGLLGPDAVVDRLRDSFPEYRRKKRVVLRQVVNQYLQDHYARVQDARDAAANRSEARLFGGECASSASTAAPKMEKESLNGTLSNLYKQAAPASEDATDAPRKKRKTLTAYELPGQGGSSGYFSGAQKKYEPEERPSLRLEDLGGIDGVLETISQLVMHPLTHPEVFVHLGVPPPTGVLLHGAPGTGKTMLAHAIAGSCGVPFFKVAAPEIVAGLSGESEAKLRSLFQEVKNAAPSLLFLDEVDCIAPKRENADRQMDRRIVAQLVNCLDELQGKPVVVLGATNNADSLDSALRRNGRFDREIPMGIPDGKARRRILEVVTKGMRLAANIDFAALALLTPGYVGADLSSLAKEAAMGAVHRAFSRLDERAAAPFSAEELAGLEVTMGDFEEAAARVQPSSKREGFSTVPDVSWENVGALSELRRELDLVICDPIRKADLYEAMGLSRPSGCLLFGPPGCGKTMVAKAVANACGANFISVKGPELLNKYVGESERAVRQVFQRAQTSSPCVIFFDELDSLVPKRSVEGNSSQERVVNQMLTEMDGMTQRRDVFVIGATNRPDILDEAMMRPGRLDRLLYVPLPSLEGRLDILKTLVKKTPLAEVDFEALVPGTEGFSGADLAGLVREATLLAIQGASVSDSGATEASGIRVGQAHFVDALRKVGPSISPQQRREYLELANRVKRCVAH